MSTRIFPYVAGAVLLGVFLYFFLNPAVGLPADINHYR